MKLKTPADTVSPKVLSKLPAASSLKGNSQSPCAAALALAFCESCAVVKMFKDKPEELTQEDACNKPFCLALKNPEGTL